MNSSIYSQPVYPIEDYERFCDDVKPATFDDAVKTAKPRPAMSDDKRHNLKAIVSACVAAGALAYLWVKS